MSAPLPQEVQKELENFIVAQAKQVPELAEDATDVAEYLVILISNGRTPEEVYTELSSIFASEAIPNLVQNAFNALQSYQGQQGESATQTTQEQPQEQQQGQEQQAQQQAQPQDAPQQPAEEATDTIVTDSDGADLLKNIPSRPAAYNRNNNNGIQKGRGGRFQSGPRSFAFKNPESLQKALGLTAAAGTGTFVNARGVVKKKGRCHQFPYCPNKECPYAHPTKPCFNFLNGACPNEPGTCNYLHPGQDDALMAELEKTSKAYQEKKMMQKVAFAQSVTGITLCKFGILCTNQQCPFGHPTPANEDAKVITFEWCPANLQCQDPTCSKAHSSLSKIKPVKAPTASTAGGKPQQEKSLEPCKFGQNCTNRFCKFRHATTKTLCREGAQCTRIDCFFSHPINEDCRFGDDCKNPSCLFKHPGGKPPSAGNAVNKSWTKTSERPFAVPDSEVLEQAPPQEG